MHDVEDVISAGNQNRDTDQNRNQKSRHVLLLCLLRGEITCAGGAGLLEFSANAEEPNVVPLPVACCDRRARKTPPVVRRGW